MSFGEFVNGYYDVEGQLPEYIKKRAKQDFLKQDAEKQSYRTKEDFVRRRDRIRKFYLDSIGKLPEQKCPLNPICTATLARGTYQVQNIIFQSRPGFYVTANLYTPLPMQGKMPAVIFACGHIECAKAAPIYQKVCIDLVQNGFVVLAVDPISQGERIQSYCREAKRPVVRWHAEHTYYGLQCNLAGASIVRYFLWDLIRSLDYLCTLPQVDCSRIGITGNSGGGMQTTFLMMHGDSRVAAAAPCTYITSRESYMKTGQSQDGEQITFGAIAQGIDYDDYLTCFAPRPVMIGAVESDFFSVEGTFDTYEKAKSVYRLFGCEENVALRLAKGTHSYNDELREMAVNWFLDIFKPGSPHFHTDRNMKTEPPELLLCTKSGQVLEEFDHAKSISDLIREDYAACRYEEVSDCEILKKKLRRVLNMPDCRDRINPRIITKRREENEGKWMCSTEIEEIFFFSEPDICVAGLYICNTEACNRSCTVLVLDGGCEEIYKNNDLAAQILRTSDLFVFDPRGTGVVRSRRTESRPFYEMFGTEYKQNCDAMMMETSLMGLRVFDCLRACDYIRQRSPESEVRMAGKGIGAVYALFAGILNDDVRSIYLENMIDSFESILNNRFYFYDTRYDIYGILKELDLPLLLKTFDSKNIVRYNEPDVGNIIRW